ncbi:transmembrane protein 254-like [Amphiura filiformis]|uniref:transmembrane protein 254-like n=1 Tax=Amphiura filiformis TaxID=82378 RepID=UPI003B225F14
MASKGKDNEYFRLPDLSWMLLVTFGLYLMVCSLHKPDWVPFDYLGPLGALSRYLATEHPHLVNGTILVAFLIHSAYIVYTVSLMRKTQLSSSAQFKWYITIFIFGGFSLIHLRRYVYNTPHKD